MTKLRGDLESRLTGHGWTVEDSGCWEWSGNKMPSGYGYLKFKYKNTLAHRAAYETWVGTIPPGKHVLHSCDNPPCINPGHLRVGTNQDNANDRVSRDRVAFGSSSGMSKIVEQDVREIRDLYASGLFFQREIGEMYGLSQTMIGHIVRGTYWRRVI